jgi:phytoene dehydrogenase-like protein
MSTAARYDVVVIGSGPAGQKAAIQGAKVGKRVALIERDQGIGGNLRVSRHDPQQDAPGECVATCPAQARG